jgi:GT2 family glycosyltransferase
LHVQRSYDADVVAGRVLQCFDKEVPDWVLKGKFFEQYRHPTGQRLRGVYVATNNVLIRTSVLKDMGEEVFDERFALSGGSDTHLFMRVEKAGYKMVWADDAVVRDWVPKSRANARWILQRAYRLGNTLSLCERDLRPSVVVRAARVAKSAKQFLQGFLLLPASVVLGWHVFIRALQHFFRGIGMLTGMAGVRYEEYRKTHGA